MYCPCWGEPYVNRESDLRRLFLHLDRNRNGIVTFDEFLTLETNLNKNSVGKAKSFFSKLDMDKNNALEEDEFVRAILRNKEYSMMPNSTWTFWITGMMKTKTHGARELKKVGVKMKSIAYKGDSAKKARRREIAEGKAVKDMTADERRDMELLQAAEHRQRQGKIKKKHDDGKKGGHGKYVHRHNDDLEINSEDTNAEINVKLKKKRDIEHELLAKKIEMHSKKVAGKQRRRRGADDDDEIEALIRGKVR
jgi:hypothetical protein